MAKITVHVKEGDCFSELTLFQLHQLLPDWLDSNNVVTVDIMDIHGECTDCELYETDEAKQIDSLGKPYLGIHLNNKCFVLPCDKASVCGILGEFIDSPSTVEIDVWCAGWEPDADCQCGEEFNEYLKELSKAVKAGKAKLPWK